MAVREEVVVDLKVKTSGFDQTIKAMDKLAKTTGIVEKAINNTGKLLKTIGQSILQITLTMRIFQVATLGATGALGKLRAATFLWTNQMDKAIASGIKGLNKMAGVYVIVAAAALALVAAITKGAQALAFTERQSVIFGNQMSLIWETLGNQATKFGAIILAITTGQFGLLKDALAIDTRSAEEIRKLGGDMADFQIAQRDAQLERLKDQPELIILLSEQNEMLNEEQETTQDTVDLLNEKKSILQDLNELQLDELEASLSLLKITLGGTKPKADQRKIEDKIAIVVNKIELIKARSLQIDKDITREINAQEQAAKDLADELAKANKRATEPVDDEFDDFVPDLSDLDAQIAEWNAIIASGVKITTDEFNQIWEDGVFQREQATIESLKRLADADKQRAMAAIDLENAKADAVAQFTTLALTLAEESKPITGAILVAESIAGTAVAVVNATKNLATAPATIPLILATGAASVATIIAQLGASGGNANLPQISAEGFRVGPTESASPDFFRSNQSVTTPQVVLVTEDLNTVQDRVAVTEDRASIGN